MGRKRAALGEAPVAEEAAPTAAELAKPKKGEKSVFDKNGALIRTYSSEVHGEDFADLAEQFASKDEGRTVK